MDALSVAVIAWSAIWALALAGWARGMGPVVLGAVLGGIGATVMAKSGSAAPWPTEHLQLLVGVGALGGATALAVLVGLGRLLVKPGPQVALLVFLLAPLCALGHDLWHAASARAAAVAEETALELGRLVDTRGADKSAVAVGQAAVRQHARLLSGDPAEHLWSPSTQALGRLLASLAGLVPGHGLNAIPQPPQPTSFSLSGGDPRLAAIQRTLAALHAEAQDLEGEVFAHRLMGVVMVARSQRAASSSRNLVPGLIDTLLGSTP